MAKKSLRKVIVIGDSHGEYHAFAAVLIEAGLMDGSLNWRGGNTVMVQTGDIIDRGPDSLQIDKLLDILQPAARKAGGDIIRLTGNHELEIIRKNYFITSLPYHQIEGFRDKLIKGILSGAWRAAYSCRGFLITHAGVSDSLYALLKQELAPAKAAAAKTAAHINKTFKQAVRGGSYKHPIFNVSYIRGGDDRFGGIFWEDLSALFANHGMCPFRQIVGHTSVPEITVAHDAKVIAVDVGMKKVFEGKFEYLTINGRSDINIIQFNGEDNPKIKVEA